MYTFDTISSLDDFNRLEAEWNDILAEDYRYRPYLSHQWFKLWFTFFQAQSDILIVLVREKGHLAAIFPFLKKKNRLKGIGISEIELAGNSASPVRTFIFNSANGSEKKDIIQQVLRYLDQTTSWDVLNLMSLPEEMLNIHMLEDTLRDTGLRFRKSVGFGNRYLDQIDGSGQDYFDSRKRKVKKEIRRCRRKLEQLGKLEFKLITGASGDSIQDGMDRYYDVFKRSWKDWELHPTFHKDLAELGAEQGWLRLGFLLLNDQPIAVEFCLVCKRILYTVRSFYDEQYKHLAPGVILTSEMIQYSIDVDGVQEIDFLIGDEEYKRNWVPKRRVRWDFLVFNGSLKGKVVSCLIMSLIPLAERYKYLKKIKVRVSRLLGIS